MIASETSLWRWLRDGCRGMSRLILDMNRIENAASSGMPDVEGVYRAAQFWLELKVAPRPKKAETPIDVKHLRPKQVEFLHNRWLAGGSAWILLRVDARSDKALYLLPGNLAREVKAGMTEAELAELSHCEPHVDPRDLVKIASTPHCAPGSQL